MRQVYMVLLVGLIGCGVSDSKQVNEFEEDDIESFCSEIADGAREVTCEFDGGSITFDVTPDYEECVATFDPEFYAGCDLTAGNVRECYAAYDELSDAEYCDLGIDYPEECEPLFSCILGS